MANASLASKRTRSEEGATDGGAANGGAGAERGEGGFGDGFREEAARMDDWSASSMMGAMGLGGDAAGSPQRVGEAAGKDRFAPPDRIHEAEQRETLASGEASRFGSAFGADLSRVQLHTGDGVAEEHGAAAITFGSDIHFADGARKAGGAELLGHELAHTVQQGAVPTSGEGPTRTGTTAEAEAEADRAGAAGARGEAAAIEVKAPGGMQKKPATSEGKKKEEAGEDPAKGILSGVDAKLQQKAQQVKPGKAPAEALPSPAAAAPAPAMQQATAKSNAAPATAAPAAAPAATTSAPPMKSTRPTATNAAPAMPPRQSGPGANAPATAAERGAPKRASAPSTSASAQATGGGEIERPLDAPAAATAAIDPALIQTVLATGERIATELRATATTSAQSLRAEGRQTVAQIQAHHRQVVAQLGAALQAQLQLVQHSSSAAGAQIRAQHAAAVASVQAQAQAQSAQLQQDGARHKVQAQTQVAQKKAGVDAHAGAQGVRARAGAASATQAATAPAGGGSGDPARAEAQQDATTRINAKAAESFQKDAAGVEQQNREAAGQFGQQATQQAGQFGQGVDQTVREVRRGMQEHAQSSTGGMNQAACEAQRGLAQLGSAGVERLHADHDHVVAELSSMSEALCAAIEAQTEEAAAALEDGGEEAATAIVEETQAIGGEIGGSGDATATAAMAQQAQVQLESAGAQGKTSLEAGRSDTATKLRAAAQQGQAEMTSTGRAAAQQLQQTGAAVATKAGEAGASGAQAFVQAKQAVGQQLGEINASARSELTQQSAQFGGTIDSGAANAQGAMSQGTESALAEQQSNAGQVQAKKAEAHSEIGARYDALKNEAQTRSAAEESGGQKSVWGWITETWTSITSAVKNWFGRVFGDWLGGFLYGLISSAIMLVVFIAVLAVVAALLGPIVALVAGIVLLVGAIGMGIYSRFQMFEAYNGRSPGIGEGILLTLLGIADVTGVPKIVEGIAGRRAFSNGHTMEKFEAGESVGSGIVDLFGCFLLVRGIRNGFKKGGADPNKAPDPTGRVTEAKKGVWEDATKPGSKPSSWKLNDDITMDGDFKVIKTYVEANGKTGWVERAYNPTTGEFQMRNAFLEELPKWVTEGTPMVEGKGTPTVTWLTLRQMQLLGMRFGGAYKVKMSTIQNIKAIIQLHVLRTQGMDPNLALMKTHSVQYAETSIVQSGHRIVRAEIGGQRQSTPLDVLLKHYETTSNDPAMTAAKHDQMLKDFGGGVVNRGTEVWWNYDISLTVEPAPAASNAGSGGSFTGGLPGTGPGTVDVDDRGGNNQ